MIGGIFLAVVAAIAVPVVGQGASVPFVGCRSDGQIGPLDAPTRENKTVSIGSQSARRFAFYQAANGFGVLAPRGWYCFGIYGSGGGTLFVSPQPMEALLPFKADWGGFSEPVITVTHRFGDTSGRFSVAEIIARVFPTYMVFANAVADDFPQGDQFRVGPYPYDKLTYRSKRVVEFVTPARTDGLGTYWTVKKNDSPISGVAALVGKTPDLLLLSVRLPRDLADLTSAIVRQVERDAEVQQ